MLVIYTCTWLWFIVTRSSLTKYGFQLEQNSPAHFRGGSRHLYLVPIYLRKQISAQNGNTLPPGLPVRYPFLRKLAELVSDYWATWKKYWPLFSIWMGTHAVSLVSIIYLWRSHDGCHPQPRKHPMSFMDDSNETPHSIFCGNPLLVLHRVRPFRRWYYWSLAIMILPLLVPLSKFPSPSSSRHVWERQSVTLATKRCQHRYIHIGQWVAILDTGESLNSGFVLLILVSRTSLGESRTTLQCWQLYAIVAMSWDRSGSSCFQIMFLRHTGTIKIKSFSLEGRLLLVKWML